MFKKVLLAIVLAFSAGCGSKGVDQYADWEPKLDLFDYFKGRTAGSGVFFSRGGSVKTAFQLTLDGELKSENELILSEKLAYRNGETVTREFHITRTGPQTYVVECADFLEPGTITTSGNAANWKYRLRQDIGERVVTLKFDDWMYLQPDGTILNRAYAFWLGFGVGEVFMSVKKA